MKKLNICAVVAVSFGVAFGAPVAAQISGELAVPAEIPPASYKGKQYVDSRGCVYIRAGVDGNITWVPRVARDRKVICGFQPSGGSTRQAEAPRQAPEPEVIAIAPEAPAPQPPVVRQEPRKPTPKPVRTVASEPEIIVPAARTREPVVRRVQTTTRREVVHTPEPVRRAKKAPIATRKQHIKKVRTADGTQRIRVPGVKVYAGKSGASRVTNHTVIAPKAAYARGASEPVAIPEGYKPAFDDGRLSTTRAHQTLDGRRKMLLIWTSHSPRRLIDRYTGQDVTLKFPELRYPYRSMREQRAAFVSSKSAPVKAAPKPVKRQASAAVAQAASHRYVQVGSFSSPARAQGAIGRLHAAGLPVRVKDYTRKGQNYRMVLVGPFHQQRQLNAALNTVKNRIGYRSASLRK